MLAQTMRAEALPSASTLTGAKLIPPRVGGCWHGRKDVHTVGSEALLAALERGEFVWVQFQLTYVFHGWPKHFGDDVCDAGRE